jgi:ribosome maturation factor RimP
MQVHERERELQREVAEAVETRLPGVEVLAVELGGPEHMSVYIDRPGGVDLALCEEVSGVLRGYTDRFSLDVSSPGFGRPLRTPRHFADVLGRRVNLRTAHDVEGRKRFKGEVVTAGDAAVTVATGAGEIDVPYDEIVRGNLIDEG